MKQSIISLLCFLVGIGLANIEKHFTRLDRIETYYQTCMDITKKEVPCRQNAEYKYRKK